VIRVLDYGCGSGQIVKLLRKRGVDAFGCDVFYEGGDYSSLVEPGLLEAGVVRRMTPDGMIPFESGFFDYVVNNQVMEHVQNLEAVLAEIRRVLKPEGVVLSLFPDKGVWREGHCGIPFLHWFPKGSRGRVFYASFLRALGFGYHKGRKGIWEWSRDFCEWLDNWTHYRSREEIKRSYNSFFVHMEDLEDEWLDMRLAPFARSLRLLPVWLRRLVVRKLGGLVFAARSVNSVKPQP
jgi:SAM-dependent methyltransferase